jgi:hypothetical protein
MGFRFLKRINANTGLFNGHFIDAKAFYVLRFNAIPCVTFIGDMDVAVKKCGELGEGRKRA